jgi:hypothetical protein
MERDDYYQRLRELFDHKRNSLSMLLLNNTLKHLDFYSKVASNFSASELKSVLSANQSVKSKKNSATESEINESTRRRSKSDPDGGKRQRDFSEKVKSRFGFGSLKIDEPSEEMKKNHRKSWFAADKVNDTKGKGRLSIDKVTSFSYHLKIGADIFKGC